MSLLTIEGVWKTYHEHPVLRGIDLEVEAHEVVCLIGASGSGKSTLLRCVNLLEPLDSGRIYLGKEEITRRGVDVNAVRRRIGIVFQAFNLFPHMTVLENVTLGPRKARGLSKSLAVDKHRITLGTLITALFYDLSPEKPVRIPTQGEKRERDLRGFCRKVAFSRVCESVSH